MAHDYAKIMLDKANLNGENCDDYREFIAMFSHDLAETMLDEHSKRQDKSRPEALDDLQIDWSQAPDGFNYWAVDSSGPYWYRSKEPQWVDDHWDWYHDGKNGSCTEEAPLFNYDGPHQLSLRKRPEDIRTKRLVIRDGGYYQDHVNFDYYKFIESQWYRLESILSDTWIKCNQPNLKWLVEDSPLMK